MIFSYEVPVKNVLNVGITVVRPNKDCARKLLILADLDNILKRLSAESPHHFFPKKLSGGWTVEIIQSSG